MKKVYTKPIVVFEDFSLSVAIAGDCNVIISNSSENICAYITRTDQAIFTEQVTGCIYKQVDDGSNHVCYHVPTTTTDLFNS